MTVSRIQVTHLGLDQRVARDTVLQQPLPAFGYRVGFRVILG
jgi:hypothetical protein